jgi:light-regulated signal transduction histidine kinase (bacteriophytochrome)
MSNNSQVDLSNCDREPIHIPGSIQPHGFLLAVDVSFDKVLRASENAASALGQDKALQGGLLNQALDEGALHAIRNAAAASGDPRKPGLLVGVATHGAAFDVAVHRHKGAAIIEFEPSVEAMTSPLDVARTLLGMVDRAADLPALLAHTTRAIRGTLGYERVMVYQFAPDGSGKVMAELKRHDLESFLGLHFPASDIPAQARRLYLENTIRIISDVDAPRVPIAPDIDASGEPLDLSFAHLRSVSPIHCEYLRNMGVSAGVCRRGWGAMGLGGVPPLFAQDAQHGGAHRRRDVWRFSLAADRRAVEEGKARASGTGAARARRAYAPRRVSRRHYRDLA